MDSDLGAKIESVLSDPEQMAKITEMAKSLMGQAGGQTPSGSAVPAATPEAPLGEGDTRLLSALGRAFSGGGQSRSTALLVAMRPYMKPEKQEKLDRAMKIARMVNIAGTVMREYGGGHGV